MKTVTKNSKIKELVTAITHKIQLFHAGNTFKGAEIRLGVVAFNAINEIGFRRLFIIPVPENGVDRAIRRLQDKDIESFTIDIEKNENADRPWKINFIKDKKLREYEVWMEPILL